MFSSFGILKYIDNKIIVEVDIELSRYYFNQVPKYFKLNKQKYSPHISVVRNELINNTIEDKIIGFQYCNILYNNTDYFWLNVFCEELEYIRLKLGLEKSSQFTRPPDNSDCFHITIGNTKY